MTGMTGGHPRGHPTLFDAYGPKSGGHYGYFLRGS